MTGTISTRTLQVHLTRTCNLECRHCYSVSGPTIAEGLGVETVCGAIRDAAAEGYEVVALSGGEPLLYRGLEPVVATAVEAGMAVTLTTNGTLLKSRMWESVRDHLALVAVSVDGPPQLHNHIRRSPSAFVRTMEGLQILQSSGTAFGVIHTLTRASFPHLEWLGDICAARGARLLQLHPLGLVGAGSNLHQLHPDSESLTRMYLAGLALQAKHREQFAVQIDIFNRETIRARPELVYAANPLESSDGRLSDLINPLVIMSSGDVSPICHNMPAALRLGNLGDRSLQGLARAYQGPSYAKLLEYCSRLWRDLLGTLEWPYFNWYELLETGVSRRD